MKMGKSKLVLLHDADNVLVAVGKVGPGQVQASDGNTVVLNSEVTLGHKVARRDISSGESILKYGMPIGVATKNIEQGTHVHIQNVASRYTATHY